MSTWAQADGKKVWIRKEKGGDEEVVRTWWHFALLIRTFQHNVLVSHLPFSRVGRQELYIAHCSTGAESSKGM